MKFQDNTLIFEGKRELSALRDVMQLAIAAHESQSDLPPEPLLQEVGNDDAVRLMKVVMPRIASRLRDIS